MTDEQKNINPFEEYTIRCQKLEKIKELNIDPYPSERIEYLSNNQLVANFNEYLEQKKSVTIVGRLRSKRWHGGSCFANLENNWQQIQIYFKKDEVGKADYEIFVDLLDVGDIIQISGEPFLTKRGEKTILVKKYHLLNKSLLPLPEKWHGLSDIETRFRQRYLDLIANNEVKDIFLKRQAIINYLRNYLDNQSFMEVDTPILQSLAGGAIAEPFVTHHRALDIDLFLRIAPEIFLKKLIIGGFTKIYEVARCFRNEGIDHAHNPEFTQIELYWAYQDYLGLMDFTEQMISQLVWEINGSFLVNYDGHDYNFQPPWPRIDYREELIKRCKVDINNYPTAYELKPLAIKLGIAVADEWGKGKIIDELYKKYVRNEIPGPFYIVNHPIELSPLAKKNKKEPNFVDRFQLVVAGFELVNAFSELNDSFDQAERFVEQQRLKDEGDQEAVPYDAEYVEALKYGLPPTAGLGLGIDRLVQILTNQHNIKNVIFFPTLKPKLEDKK
ncbi:MAG: lysine--tRNA ligase [Candidatus Komeilibacteria bacterium CG_4_10_14_0_2_um_filter_37_10]|uniref:Lysine--tRNA ligase n=1 Tax=Candidatus Komeilibacteria bacterium CG_4_10_14_0_2_um_filter_37_10 TaxID=1974470 RepID=A0A2M7VDV8_9BACT|nr:MAG: lysine--tRNA ligase [Candidatus Komeilibacteria bacterium CG_4_10_14_0_2_um_filter_37_10]